MFRQKLILFPFISSTHKTYRYKKSPLLEGISFFIRRESGSFSDFHRDNGRLVFMDWVGLFLRNWKKEVD